MKRPRIFWCYDYELEYLTAALRKRFGGMEFISSPGSSDHNTSQICFACTEGMYKIILKEFNDKSRLLDRMLK